MAWNDFLQQGKGLYQQGKNWLTGNNLTSQDPNTIRAMNMQTNNPFDPNKRISPTSSFSDRSYEDTEGVHPPRSHSGLQSVMPHNVGNWRSNNAMNYGSTYPEAPFQPNMLDVVGDYQLPAKGIMTTNQAQKKPFINWDAFPSPGNAIRAMLGAVKDNPQEKFNKE